MSVDHAKMTEPLAIIDWSLDSCELAYFGLVGVGYPGVVYLDDIGSVINRFDIYITLDHHDTFTNTN